MAAIASGLWLCPRTAAAAALVNVAPLARLSCDPAPDGDSLGSAVDGDPGTGLVYAVGTRGEGTVTLTFSSPRRVAKVRLWQGERAYYSTAYQLTADDDGSGQFRTVLARVDGEAVWGAWVEHALAPRLVRAVRFESLAGHSEGLRARPVVREVEVYSEADPSDIRELLGMGVRPAAILALKPLCLETPLVAGGRAACSILVPDEVRYRALGEQVAQVIGKTFGATPPVTSAPGEATPAGTSVIALGQMLNNPLIERLYWNHYLYLDSLCPGRDGYVVQSVHNPYPWTAGHNVIVLGGSTFEGVQRAVAQFERRLPAAQPTGSLGYLLEVSLPPPGERETGYVVEGKEYTNVTLPARDLSQAEAAALVAAEPNRSLLSFQELALRYLVTGERPYLEAGKRVLAAMADLYDQDPERHPTWPEETNARFIFAAWDATEEAPVFTDEERLRFTNTLLRFLYSLVGQTSDYNGLEANDTIVWNHTTFPLLGLYWGGRYFRRYYDAACMDTFLAKAAGAFRGQEKSWKPQCDADSYLTITMGHTIEYALAEERMAFFENGNLRRYADYLMGICDNRGWAAGFGDSGVFRSTAVPDAGIPYAFWHTKEPRYLGYLNAIHGGRWVNPFHQGVTPEPPVQNLGVQVYPLDRQVYDFTATRPYYGEPSGPPNVPFEQAFDKIAFRAGLGAADQYFLLDGYARGKHLHYDGNAILKLTDKGEDWLVDGDYLVRNTTEHNMVSVVNNGRAERLVPECAALLHQADLPTYGFTETMVRDDNGVDWHRGIAWRKGGWIVLIDRLVAVSAGDYRFDCVFKCLDQGGEALEDARRFRISRGGILRTGNLGLDRVALPEGEALAFTRNDSQLQFGMRLRPGRYRATLWARGVDSSADSFWLSVDGEEPTAFHLPLGKIGPSSATPAKTEPSPEIRIGEAGEHTLTITLREGPGPVLERVTIEGVEDPRQRLEFRAIEAPPAAKVPPVRRRSFYIVNADGATLSTAARIGSSGPVKYLFQRRKADLAAGEQTAFRNLLYLDDVGESKAYSAEAVGDAALRVRADQPALVGLGPFADGRVQTDAAMFCLAGDRVCLVDATALTGREPLFVASAPVSAELDLDASQAVFVATQTTTVRLAGAREPLELAPGRHSLALPGVRGWQRRLRNVLKHASTKAPAPAASAGTVAVNARGLSELWRLGDDAEQPEIRDLTAAAFEPGGPQHLLVCRGPELQCHSGQGQRLWTFAASRRLRCVATADLDGDGRTEVLCGGDDEQIHILDHTGKERASHTLTERLVVGQGGTVLPYVNCLLVDDLDGDGRPEIVAGCTNSQISAFDTNLERLWNRDGIYHGVRKVLASDLDGDGKKEVLAADHYGSVAIIAADGRSCGGAYSELGDVCFDVGDINGDGRPELVNGSSTGVLSAFSYPVTPLFQFSNYGYAVREVKVLDLEGDGRAAVLVASDTGYLYALDGGGKVRWQRDLGAALLAMAIGQTGRPGVGGRYLAVGQRDGTVRALDLAGAPLAEFAVGRSVKFLKCFDLNGDGADEIVVVDTGNRCFVLGLSL